MLSVREEESGVNGGGLKVTGVGYVEIDKGEGGAEKGEEQPWRGPMVGRRSFGRFNRALEVRSKLSCMTMDGHWLKQNVLMSLFMSVCEAKLTDIGTSRSNRTPKPISHLLAIQTPEVPTRTKIARKMAKMIAMMIPLVLMV